MSLKKKFFFTVSYLFDVILYFEMVKIDIKWFNFIHPLSAR